MNGLGGLQSQPQVAKKTPAIMRIIIAPAKIGRIEKPAGVG
jgi:hypothetical protein